MSSSFSSMLRSYHVCSGTDGAPVCDCKMAKCLCISMWLKQTVYLWMIKRNSKKIMLAACCVDFFLYDKESANGSIWF